MNDGFRQAITRLVSSQKVIAIAITAVCNLIATSTGADPTSGVLAVFNGLMGVLIGVQALLDLRWGSQSDKTGVFKVAPVIMLCALVGLSTGCSTFGLRGEQLTPRQHLYAALVDARSALGVAQGVVALEQVPLPVKRQLAARSHDLSMLVDASVAAAKAYDAGDPSLDQLTREIQAGVSGLQVFTTRYVVDKEASQ